MQAVKEQKIMLNWVDLSQFWRYGLRKWWKGREWEVR